MHGDAVHTNARYSHAASWHQGFWTLRRRMFVQMFAALLPLMALSVYEAELVSSIVADVNSRPSSSELSVQAVSGYRVFLNGVTDAVDSSQLGAKPIDALHRCVDALQQLQAQQPSEELRRALDATTQIQAAIAVNVSIKALLPLRASINVAEAAIRAADSQIQEQLAQRVEHEQQSGLTRRRLIMAFRTDILAINAAAEAARAGDSGRGFAAVASEVRELANRSATTAKKAKELTGKTFARLDDGTGLVQQAGEQMKEIIAAVRSLKETTPAALATSRRQLEDSDQVARTVTELDAMTRQNSLFVQKFAQASEAVCELVGDLEAAAGRSQIDRSGSSSAVAARKWKRST